MTAPLGTGFPDYGRYSAQSTKTYLSELNVSIDATVDYGPYFVGDVTHIGLRFRANTNGFIVRLQFYADEALAIALGEFPFDFPTNANLFRSFPVVGAWVIVQVQPTGAGSFHDVVLTSARGEYVGARASTMPSLLVTQNFAPIGAGVILTFDVDRVYEGIAVWTCYSTLATWAAALYARDRLGNLSHLDRCDNTDGHFSRSLILPGAPTRLTFQNTTAGAGNVFLALMAHGLYPGA